MTMTKPEDSVGTKRQKKVQRRHVAVIILLGLLAALSLAVIAYSLVHLYVRDTTLHEHDLQSDQRVARIEQRLCSLEVESRKDLQQIAVATHVRITVSPAPPGTCQ